MNVYSERKTKENRNKKGSDSVNYDSSGAAVKVCARCGKVMRIENWFAALSTKYCDECRVIVKQEQTAECLRNKRKKERERRNLEREKMRLLEDENEILRHEIAELRARMGIEERGLK